MRRRSLRLFLPLVLLLAMLIVGGLSLTYALYQKQQALTRSARLDVLRDVAHLVRLADELPAENSTLLAEELAQVASQPWVQVVLLVSESGGAAVQSGTWRSRSVRGVWPALDLARLRKTARGRLPDWQMRADGMRMDALQSFTASREDESAACDALWSTWAMTWAHCVRRLGMLK